MKQFKLYDNILGWLTFLIASFVYCSTIEPTASFWDCPEFIVTGYKLEIVLVTLNDYQKENIEYLTLPISKTKLDDILVKYLNED